jgi:transposase
VELVDLPAFGRPCRLVWRKHRWSCVSPDCPTGSWTELAPAIAAARLVMTDRAGRWVTEQVGRWGRTVNEVAVELGCDWHTINDTVVAYGTALVDDDPDRIGTVSALGLDETLFVRRGPWRRQEWCTSIVDVRAGRLLDIVAGRSASEPCAWLARRGQDWLDGIDFATLDLSGPTASCSTRCCPTPSRWPTRFTWSSWPTPPSTSVGGGCRTTRSAIEAANTTPSTGAGAS